MIEVAVVGCGHMGAHHARTIAGHAGCRLVALVDVRPERAEELAARFGGRACSQLPEQVDAVVVATPTASHARVASPLLARGAWCLIEKPLASTSGEVDLLLSPRVRVGHSERFNPAVRALGPTSPKWIRAVREAPPATRGADVHVALDLLVHDLDLALWWCGADEVGDVRAWAEDGDALGVRVGLGAATLVARVSRSAERRARTIELEDDAGRVHLDLLAGRGTRNGAALSAPDGRDALEAQWDAFVRAVHGEAEGADAWAGARALRLAERIVAELRDTVRA